MTKINKTIEWNCHALLGNILLLPYLLMIFDASVITLIPLIHMIKAICQNEYTLNRTINDKNFDS